MFGAKLVPVLDRQCQFSTLMKIASRAGILSANTVETSKILLKDNILVFLPSRLSALRPLAFLSGFILLTLYLQSADKRSSASSQHTSDNMAAFSLLVTLQFTAEEHKEAFLKYISPLAKYVNAKEPDTIAYKVLLSDKDPLRVLIMERYKDRENAFLKVHRTSEPFLEFRPKLQALQEAGFVNVVGESYDDSDVGFGDRLA